MAEAILKINRIISRVENVSEWFARLLGRFLKVLTFSPFEEDLLYRKSLTLSLEKGSVSLAYGSSLLSNVKVRMMRSFNYDEGRFPYPDEVANAATSALGQFKKKPNVTLIIPKSWTVLKIAEFPVTVKENLQNVLSFEMDRLTPFNPEDVFYDYRIIREEDNRLSLLVAATKKDTVRPYIEALQEKGIDVKRITVSMTAMAALNSYSGGKGGTILLDFGKNFYEAGLFEGSVTVDHISGSFETEDDKTRVTKVVKELQPFLEKVKSSGSTPEILLLLRDSTIKETLRSMINYPLRILGETDLRLKLPTTKDIPYIALGGLVESLIEGESINLLSTGKREKRQVPYFLTLILLISIFSLAAIYFITPLRVEEKRLNAIETEIAKKKIEAKKVEALKKEVEDLRDEVASINNFKEGRSSLAILKEMTLILPKNTWLTRFRITETNVDIEGYAGSATELLPKLEASKYFRKAEFSSPTFRDARMNADRFIIKMEIETTKKPEVQLEKK